MEVGGHEGREWGAVLGWDVVEAAVDGAAELGQVIVVATLEDIAFDKLPQTFDQVQIRRVGWQEL